MALLALQLISVRAKKNVCHAKHSPKLTYSAFCVNRGGRLMHLVIFSHSHGTAENENKTIQKDTTLMLLRANFMCLKNKMPVDVSVNHRKSLLVSLAINIKKL